jgi:nucleoside-diphosphate-sugar epimerase
MSRAIIGHTGFVGGNLCRQGTFDATFNSKNINDLESQSFDEIWCAGVQAVKWWANKNPDEDRRGIQRLLDVLATVRAGRFVFMSTVDVFGDPIGVDEATPVDLTGLHPYGRHRYQAEEWVRDRFDNHVIVRLPGLFGPGLKKNIIYDFMHGNQLDMVHADAVFQFYGLDRLSSDIGVALDAGLPLIHLATEPVSVSRVAEAAFGMRFTNRPSPNAPRYDMRTRHNQLWKRDIPYIETADEVLSDIAAFVAAQKETK